MNSVKLYKRLLRYLLPFKGRLVSALAFMGLTSAMIAGQTFLVKPMLDKVLLSNPMNFKLALLVPPALILVSFLKGVTSYIRDYLLGYVGQRIINRIRDDIYAHIQTLSFSYFTRTPTGIIMSRITNDVNMVQGAITRAPSSLAQGILTMAALIGYVLYLNWRLAAVSFIVLPLAGLAMTKFSRRLRKASTQVQEQIAFLNTHLHETIAGVRIVKAFGMEEYESRRFAEKNKDLFNSFMRSIKTYALSHPVMEFITMLGTSLVIMYGIYSIYRGIMTIGDFFSFLMALVFFYRPLKELNGINNVIQDGLASAKRIFDVMDTEPEIRSKQDSRHLPRGFNTIDFKNVSFRYEDDLVLRDINLTVRAGETIAIVGKSGGGKTTLVNLIPRFYDVSGGSISVDGIDIRDATLESLRSLMAIVTQQTILFNDTVRNNIAYGKLASTQDNVVSAATSAYADEFIRALPRGYDTIIGEAGVKLSGGQRQRIAIARALLKDAPILILDEATSSLDSESEREVQSALERLMQGRTSFVIAHRLSTVIKADRIIVLKGGRIVEQGNHEVLLRRGGEYQSLYEQQFRDEPSSGGG